MTWQTMESAPKDGTTVILFGAMFTYCCNPSDTGGLMGEYVVAGSYQAGKWRAGWYDIKPTHWCPLPARPAAPGEEMRSCSTT